MQAPVETLPNKKFIFKLPTKGKKTLGSVVKLQTAIAGLEGLGEKSEGFYGAEVQPGREATVRGGMDTEEAQNSETDTYRVMLRPWLFLCR